jgi:hypothetical protein
MEDRVGKCANRSEPTDDASREGSREEFEMKGTEEPAGTNDRTAATPPERLTMAEKPLLIIESAGNGSPFNYQCSRCLQVFPLATDDSPKSAVAELYRRFRAHVTEEHE